MRYITTLIIAITVATGAFAQIEQPRRILEEGEAGGLNLSQID